MVQVTKEEFFAELNRDHRDIMPNVNRSEGHTVWEDRHGSVFGKSFPGWKNPGDPKSYWIAR